MPEASNTDDPGTLSYFMNFLGKSIPNAPNQMKKEKNYPSVYAFKEAIGIEMLTVALECFKVECDSNSISFPQSKDGAKEFFSLFLAKKNIELWYKFGRTEPEYFAYHRVMILYMLNTRDIQVCF